MTPHRRDARLPSTQVMPRAPMRMRKRNTLLVLALLWAVLAVVVLDGARRGDVPTAAVIALLVAALVVIPIFWRLFRRAREPER